MMWPARGRVSSFQSIYFDTCTFPHLFSHLFLLFYLTEWLAVGFGLLAVADIVAQYFQTYLFEVIGERMTRRIRTDYFRSLLRQDMGWFDDPANALGVLTSRLAVDIKLIRLTVGQGTGSTVSSMTAILAALIISLIAAWLFALAFLATVPLLAVTEAINWALMKGGDSASKKVSCQPDSWNPLRFTASAK